MKKLGLILALVVIAGLATAQTTIFSDNMTNFPTGWTLSPSSGGWTKVSNRYYSSSYSARGDDVNPYGANQNNYMTRSVSLSSYSSATLTFYLWQYTESGYDYIRVQYYSGSTWTTAWQQAGSYQSWAQKSVSIPTSATQIRFWFYSDGSVQNEGVYLDDVVLTASGGTVTQNDAGSGGDAGNTFASALSVNPGSWTGCYLSSTDTTDYYKFNVTSGQQIKVKITPGSGLDFDLYLYNPSQVQKASSTAGAGVADSVVFTADATGYWYAKAKYYSGTAGNYGLSIATVSPQPFKYICFKVGQGDAALLISPTGKYALIDGGPDNTAGLSIWKFLRDSLRTHHLDYIFTSHYHSDHIGGTDLIIDSLCAHGLDSIIVGCYDRGGTYSSTDYTNYVNRAGSKRRTASLGQIFDLGGGLRLQTVCLNGKTISGDSVVPASSDENGRSLGLLITYNGFKLISAGDIAGYNTGDYKNIESILAPDIGPVNVLHVNHHGSSSSTNQTWVNTLDPQVSIISLGDGNSYGYPKAETLTRLTSDPGADNYIYQTEAGSGAAIPAGRGQVCNSNIWVVVNSTTYTVCSRSYNIAKGGAALASREPAAPPRTEGDHSLSIHPNPISSGGTEIFLEIGTPSQIEGAIYNILGQKVYTLCQGVLPSGRHRFAWNGRDTYGRRLAAGAYLLRMTINADGQSTVVNRKILVVR